MNIIMLTNTFLPFVGGVEKSVDSFSAGLRKLGHRVKIVAPSYKGYNETDENVIRVPALQQFNGTDFSVQLPVPGILKSNLKTFTPHIVHSHHPYLLGDTALRLAAQLRVPVVFTFHTYYERYTHYVPGNSPALRRFVRALATGYANLCDCVIAPSQSVADEIRNRGVVSPMKVIPTGISLSDYSKGDGRGFRKRNGIPSRAFLVGFISRIAQEKNVEFLAKAVKFFLRKNKNAHFLVVGDGPCREKVMGLFAQSEFSDRFHYCSTLCGTDLIDAYHSLDVFSFSSHTETQGLVLTEALAAGVPVVALDVPNVREIVKDKFNGRLVGSENVECFAHNLSWVAERSGVKRAMLRENALSSVKEYDFECCVKKVHDIYADLVSRNYTFRERNDSSWERAMRMIKAELELVRNMTKATGAAIAERRVEGGEADTRKK
ncbi:Glycosyl transferase, group 1 [Chitinispirillum alkaliphilum]|nr:Glycosyl transferase, group 1 [Chitinispirillum alkaliphilum]